ncbi:glycosyltransferase family 39 protein [Sediminispirochaeta smaragdinae]|uniref:Glycosyltransferase RgtA/B/C/D-like domain-containing protein n=1 Tax=Sediminispirochaeta smaragdinae (strain DSM 11293 / JCM 15392 / SEBR 4228) TaxID=573413 RepID=E1R8X7_SEDSS|nr:glycosyltransferase family 39 protein [Sediminispirochaeta smaragdinae]ADK82946.1 hypothetical protein Spirs_3861 [Sediminispirochaeta smaragdinae DSM 11293]
MSLPQRRERTIDMIILLLLSLLLFSSRLIMLSKSSEPCGLDGYFYAMEARSFMERGHLENFSLAPFYYVSGLLGLLSGSPILGVKIASALCSALLPVALFLLLNRLFSNQRAFALLASLVASASPSLALMAVNYLNNLLGLVFFLFFCLCILSFLDTPAILSGAGTILCAAGAVLSHPVTAVYLFVLFLLFLCSRLSRRLQIFLLSIAGVVAILALLFKGDYLRFRAGFSLLPGLPLLSPFFRKHLPVSVCLEMSLLFLLVYLFAFLYVIKKRTFSLLLLGIPVLYFPFWRLDSLDLGYRLFLSATPCGIALTCFFAAELFPKALGRQSWLRPFLAGVGVFLTFATITVYKPKQDPPYGLYRKVVASVDLSDDSLVIAHQGLNHVYTFYKDFRDALNYEPDFPVPEGRLWRLAYEAPESVIKRRYPAAVETGEIRSLGYGYLLIREKLWQDYLAWEDEPISRNLKNWYNPHSSRPRFVR